MCMRVSVLSSYVSTEHAYSGDNDAGGTLGPEDQVWKEYSHAGVLGAAAMPDRRCCGTQHSTAQPSSETPSLK